MTKQTHRQRTAEAVEWCGKATLDLRLDPASDHTKASVQNALAALDAVHGEEGDSRYHPAKRFFEAIEVAEDSGLDTYILSTMFEMAAWALSPKAI